MFQEPRSTDQRGGGVGIMFKKSLNIRPVITELTFTSFECQCGVSSEIEFCMAKDFSSLPTSSVNC